MYTSQWQGRGEHAGGSKFGQRGTLFPGPKTPHLRKPKGICYDTWRPCLKAETRFPPPAVSLSQTYNKVFVQVVGGKSDPGGFDADQSHPTHLF